MLSVIVCPFCLLALPFISVRVNLFSHIIDPNLYYMSLYLYSNLFFLNQVRVLKICLKSKSCRRLTFRAFTEILYVLSLYHFQSLFFVTDPIFISDILHLLLYWNVSFFIMCRGNCWGIQCILLYFGVSGHNGDELLAQETEVPCQSGLQLQSDHQAGRNGWGTVYVFCLVAL